MTSSSSKSLGSAFWKELAGHKIATPKVNLGEFLACPDDLTPLIYSESKGSYFCHECEREFEKQNQWMSMLFSAAEEVDIEMAALPEISEDFEEELWELASDIIGDSEERRVLLIGKVAIQRAMDILPKTCELVIAAFHPFDFNSERELDKIQISAERIPFVEEVFDLVITSQEVYRKKRPEKFLTDISRVLKPEGLFLDIGEPIGKGTDHSSTDPRMSGKLPALGDYEAMFQQADLKFSPWFPKEIPNQKPGIVEKMKHWLGHRISGEPRIFLGTPKIPVNLSKYLPKAFTRMENEDEPDRNDAR